MGERTIPKTWIVWDPWNAMHVEFATKAEAVAHAEMLVETGLDDGQWDEDTETITVSRLTHVTHKRVVAHPYEDVPAGEWWEFDIVPVAGETDQ